MHRIEKYFTRHIPPQTELKKADRVSEVARHLMPQHAPRHHKVKTFNYLHLTEEEKANARYTLLNNPQFQARPLDLELPIKELLNVEDAVLDFLFRDEKCVKGSDKLLKDCTGSAGKDFSHQLRAFKTDYKSFTEEEKEEARTLLLTQKIFWKDPNASLPEKFNVDQPLIDFLFKEGVDYKPGVVKMGLFSTLVKHIQTKKGFDETLIDLTFETADKREKARYAALHDDRFRKEAYKGQSIEKIDPKLKLTDILNLEESTLLFLFVETERDPNAHFDKTIGECLRLRSRKAKRQTIDELVQYLPRHIDHSGNYAQRTGHLEIANGGEVSLNGYHYKAVKDRTVSSGAIKDKRYDKKLEDYNGNNAVVTGEGKHYCGRSARSDTPGRILELMMTNYLSSADSANKPGISHDTDGNTYFTFSITSGQDRNRFKYWLAKKGLGEDELSSVLKIEESINQIWGDKPFIVMKNALGEEVRVKRPLFKTQVFSGFSGDPQYIDDTRETNRKASEREKEMLMDLFDTLPDTIYKEMIHIFESEAKVIPKDVQVRTLLKHIEKSPDRVRLMKHYFALEAVSIQTKGTTLSGDPLRGEFDQAKVILLEMYLREALNIAECYQCKSGCDRTLELTAMKMSLVDFEKNTGLPFNPFHLQGAFVHLDPMNPAHQEQLEFATYFRQFAKDFGANIVNSVRGENFVKWDNHKIPLLFCDPSSETKSIKGLRILFSDFFNSLFLPIYLTYRSAVYWFSHHTFKIVR